ncbi:MAG: ABC transporter ATP-binding protein [Desulfamplus sp.]|nr:ABC transporter ATP-binding protein [Desulfamplus sp.]
MKKHYQLLKPYIVECRLQIIGGFVSLLIVDILQLFIPRIIKWVIDGISLMSVSKLELFKYTFYIIASAMLISIFRFFWRYMIMGAARRAEEGIREHLFNHIQTLPASFFDKNTAGDIMAHATNDITNIRMALSMGLVGLTDTIVLGCAAIIFMVYINLELTILALLPMPFIAVFTKIFSKKLFESYLDVQAGFSDLMESTRERFAGIRIIKAFNREELELASIKRESEIFVKKNMDLVKLRGIIFPLVIFLTQISLAIILGVGGRKVILSQISPGDFVAFISYLGLLTWPVMAIGWVTNMIQRGAASIDRINAILDIKGEIGIGISGSIFDSAGIGDSPDDIDKEIKGSIQFAHVSFSYPVNNSISIKNNDMNIKSDQNINVRNTQDICPKILNNVSFRLKEGEMLGIAGPPGSGKSTLVTLIPSIYDAEKSKTNIISVTERIEDNSTDQLIKKNIKNMDNGMSIKEEGGIIIDNMDISSIPVQMLRRAISFMPQEPFLFSGTIKSNLLFGNPEANEDKIAQAIEMAQLTTTIASLPKGIETVIGEKGVMLSGGQKQRIALARAFLKSSPILILDDPVSQVDMETASKIIKTIESFAGRRTIIVVSHRFSIFKKADKIIVLDKGEIIEQGTHTELIEQNGYYARAWQMQESEDDLKELNQHRNS